MITTNIPYYGNGAYCYANSISMLLSSINEKIPPSLIEVLSGVGLGAFFQQQTNLLYFNWELPDNGIDNALGVLGINYDTIKISKKEATPLEKLVKDVEKGPIVVGPIDMGYLIYNPNYLYLKGSDHFILIYGADKENIYLHDPAGFPHVELPVKQLQLSWESDKIGYGTEFYRYWTNPRRFKNLTEREIFDRAIKLFKILYQICEKKTISEGQITGKKAIITCVERIKNNKLTKTEVEHFVYFALPLASRRATDYAEFFKQHNQVLSNLKRAQATLFGNAQYFVISKNWKKAAENLEKLADVEEKFKTTLLSS